MTLVLVQGSDREVGREHVATETDRQTVTDRFRETVRDRYRDRLTD